MKVLFENGSAVIENAGRFNLRDMFESGQTFRFEKCENGCAGVAHGRFMRFSGDGEKAEIYPCTKEEYYSLWENYLDLARDYDALFSETDEYLKAGMEYGKGLRVLNQEPFETLISFIISANNNIKRIKGIVARLCESYGEPFEFEGREYKKFPLPKALAEAKEEDILALGAGYRASYIIKTAKAVADGFDLEALRGRDYFDAKKELCTLMGVGPKVADCILLFSLGYSEAFPSDVWIKRVLKELYGFEGSPRATAEFALQKYGKNAGFAQQYLFFWARENMKL